MDNRLAAQFLVGGRDIEAQLLAIKSLLARNQRQDEELEASLGRLRREAESETGEIRFRTHDVFVDECHGAVFQDAAHSMSAVGMLAPFIESLFVAIFSGLRRLNEGKDFVTDVGCRGSAADDCFWDPHFVFDLQKPRKDVVAGIGQLADAVDLTGSLPDGYLSAISALFAYRNKMFHHGFEWPQEERCKFGARIVSDNWQESWFSKSTYDGQVWFFYLSGEFVSHCLSLIDGILDGVGASVRPNFQVFGAR